MEQPLEHLLLWRQVMWKEKKRTRGVNTLLI